MTTDPLADDGIDLVGVDLDGRYRIERYVGAGTMGSVYEATQLAVGRRVAIKILNQALKTNTEVRERFRVEAQAIAALNHPNCITLFDFGYSDRLGALYMVVEFLDGSTLEERLAVDVPVQEALAIGHQVADVLAQAHEAGILHRDLKPENVMLVAGSGSSPVVKVLDFGLARIFQETGTDAARLTRQGQLFGTPAYMSPEQCAGVANVGPAADVYALGITLYELLGGFLPFVSENITDLLIMHAKEPPPPLVCDADPAVIELVMSMLAKDPGDRPTSPEVADALRDYAALAGHAPAHPRRSSLPAEVIAPKARREPGHTTDLNRLRREDADQQTPTDTLPPERGVPLALLAILLLVLLATVGVVAFIAGPSGDGDELATAAAPAIAAPTPDEAPAEEVPEVAGVEPEAIAELDDARTRARDVASSLATGAVTLAEAEPPPEAQAQAQVKATPTASRKRTSARTKAAAPKTTARPAAAVKKEPRESKERDEDATIKKLEFRY